MLMAFEVAVLAVLEENMPTVLGWVVLVAFEGAVLAVLAVLGK